MIARVEFEVQESDIDALIHNEIRRQNVYKDPHVPRQPDLVSIPAKVRSEYIDSKLKSLSGIAYGAGRMHKTDSVEFPGTTTYVFWWE